MKVSTNENYSMVFEKVYNPIILKTDSNEILSICMRDSGFEFTYQRVKYSAQNGSIIELGTRGVEEESNKPNVEKDYGIFPPPTKAEDALRTLIDHFLGKDWYTTSPISQEQVYTEAVELILEKSQKKNFWQKLLNL